MEPINPPFFDVIVIGAGAAGLMAAAQAGQRGRKVLVLDHAKKPAEKIRISGGGRCNFTNIHASPKNYLSANPHFCVSALSRYTARDFLTLVEKHGIAYHEKTLGQLFCNDSAQQIIDMLLAECAAGGVEVRLNTSVQEVQKPDDFVLHTSAGELRCASLIIASGGLSIPKMGATDFGYRIAKQFGHSIVPTEAALVPFTLSEVQLAQYSSLSGVAVDAVVRYGKTIFREGMLFTHRGLSGPSILQISSYWQQGEAVEINLLPDMMVEAHLLKAKTDNPRQAPTTALAGLLPQRVIQTICAPLNLPPRLADMPNKQIAALAKAINEWALVPHGTEGYRTAEVTRGGGDTTQLSSKTMASNLVPNLYFIGEVVDVTGHLGGFNFQWAWASGVAAGQVA